MIEQALAYTRIGWRVFPCHWIIEGKCSCRRAECGAPAKHPLTEHGFLDATTDEQQVRAWWTRWPSANIGIATGNGLAVLDFDGEEHADSWPHEIRAMRKANTPRSKTGRDGGMHVFGRVPDGVVVKSRAGVWPGIDVRGDGGYVIVPPSAHVLGRHYEWINDPSYELVELPAELVDALSAPPAERPASNNGATWIRLSNDQEAEIRSALRVLSAEPRDQWLRICMALKSTGAGEQAYEIWEEWSRTCPAKYTPEACREAWGSVTETLRDGTEMTIRSLFFAAHKAGWVNPLSTDTPTAVPSEAPVSPPKPWQWKTDLDYVSSPFMAPRYIVKGIIPAGAVTLVFGPSMACKSLFVLDLAHRVARGIPFAGRKVRSKEPVAILANEGREGFDARFKVWHTRFGSDELIERDARRVLVLDQRVPDLAAKKSWDDLHNALAAFPDAPVLVVVDTLSTCAHLDDENSNAAVAAVVAYANDFAQESGLAVVIVHHTRKGAGQELGLDSARGAGALGANVSAAIQLRRTGDVVTASIVKMKDGPGEIDFAFHREFVTIGLDEDGEAVSPPVLVFDAERGRTKSEDATRTVCQAIADADPENAGLNDKEFRAAAIRAGVGDRARQDQVAGSAVGCGWLEITGGGGRGRSKSYRLTSDAPVTRVGAEVEA